MLSKKPGRLSDFPGCRYRNLITTKKVCKTFYTHRRSKFGTGVPVKGRRKTIHVGSMPASMLAKPLPNNPLPPQVLPKFEVRKV
jgi:hypothetical protein